ncbi:hypothetical protein [Streptomyces sp. 5-10]|uniref:hypothetical protein n=1 Tax=Streptomyces sp. 5-10 TaxID=878925 RepID=UPI00168B72FC|nr:hypothetical protein [Streptomyces sp. 5-10]MBD3004699.1 hypothetical protein [Streptomyces sp. 5-10]
MQTYRGLIEKVYKRRPANNSWYIRFKLNMQSPELFFAWEDGTDGYDVIEQIKQGDAVEVDAELISGTNQARADRIRLADRELVCDKTLAQQAMEDAGQDGLF